MKKSIYIVVMMLLIGTGAVAQDDGANSVVLPMAAPGTPNAAVSGVTPVALPNTAALGAQPVQPAPDPSQTVVLPNSQASTSPDVKLATKLEPPVIPYHKQAEFTVTMEVPGDMQARILPMNDRLAAAGLLVRDATTRTERLKDGRKRLIETYTIEAIFAGEYPLAPAVVEWGEKGENKGAVASPALRVRVLTPEEEAAAGTMAENAGPMDVNLHVGRKVAFWGGISAAVLIAVLLVVWLVIRLRKRGPVIITIPPWETAYRRLRELDQRQLPQQGKFEIFYVDLSSIVRYYIEDRFRLRAPELTTQEFLVAASGTDSLSRDQKDTLGQFLRHCDLVKFAQYVPNQKEMEYSFDTVLRFVDETTPRPEGTSDSVKTDGEDAT